MSKQSSKEAKQTRLKTGREIEKAKQKHDAFLDQIHTKIQASKLAHKKLKLQVKKDLQALKAKQKLEKLKSKKVFGQQLSIIHQNEKEIVNRKKEFANELTLEKINRKNTLVKLKKDNRSSLQSLKQEIHNQRGADKLKVARLKNDIKQKHAEILGKLKAKEAAFLEKQKEVEAFLSSQKKEVIEQEFKLQKQIRDQHVQAQRATNERLVRERELRLDLKLKVLKAKGDIRKQILEIRLKNAKTEKEKQVYLEGLRQENQNLERDIRFAKRSFEESMKEISSESQEVEITTKVQEETQVFGQKNALSNEKEEPSKEALPRTYNEQERVNLDLEEEQANDFQPRSSFGFATGENVRNFSQRKVLKLLEKFNKPNSSVAVAKLKPQLQEEVNAFRSIKKANAMSEIIDFVKYAAFVEDKHTKNVDLNSKINNLVANVLAGKTLQFLNGYIYLKRKRGVSRITFSEQLANPHQSQIISFPQDGFYNYLNSFMLNKLKKGCAVKIGANVCLVQKDNQPLFLHDTGFLKA